MSINAAQEAFLAFLRAKIIKRVVVTEEGDHLEITDPPVLVLVGPNVQENRALRGMQEIAVSVNLDAGTYEGQRRPPRYYSVEYQLLLFSADGERLAKYRDRILQRFPDNPHVEYQVEVGADGLFDVKADLVEVTAMGSFRRPNLSNLKQVSGIYRLENVPVFSDEVFTGKLVTKVTVEMYLGDSTSGGPFDTLTVTDPPEESS